jgi:hypothetical protein
VRLAIDLALQSIVNSNGEKNKGASQRKYS